MNGKEPYHPAIQREQHLYKVSLEPSHKNLTICFSGFTYSDPAYMSYEYKMEGMDDDWQLLGGKSELTYYDLSSGKYQFKIRRIGEPGSEICLSVTIASIIDCNNMLKLCLLPEKKELSGSCGGRHRNRETDN